MNRILIHRPKTTLLARYFHGSRYNYGVIKPFLLADIGEGITDCEVVQWFVKPGDTVNEFDKICEVQSDKASVEISSRYSGKINKIYYEKHQVAKVGQPLVDIETDQEGDNMVEPPATQPQPATITTITTPDSATAATTANYKLSWRMPAVRRLLSEYGLNVSDIVGSGKNGQVLKQDVLKIINNGSLKKVQVAEKKKENPTIPQQISSDHSVPLTNIQKTMFKNMTDALSIPQLGYKDEIVLDATSEYRQALNDYIQQHNTKFPFKRISYLPILIKSMSLSLSYYPLLNAKLSGGIQYRDYHHIGIAMDTPHGLLVPNIKHVEKKTIFEIAHEIHRLTDLAKTGTIPPSDLEGGTITISNLGSIGGTFSNPVIVPNELAIVALGTARKLPRFDVHSNALVARQILPVSWSADHRIIDGATIAQFGNTWKKLIENPALLASELR